MAIAILADDLATIEHYPASNEDVQAVVPGLQLGTVTTDASLEDWPRLVMVRPTPRPVVERWQRPEELPPVLSGGVWQQAWQVVDLYTLAEAKAFLREQAKAVWWKKWLEEPTGAQADAADLNPLTVMQTRAGALQTAAQNFSAQISSAATLAECWALLETLEAA